MVLVVNKMDRTNLGNTPEQQEIIAADLQKVITSFSSKDLFLSFTDTESYFEAQDETDSKSKKLPLEQSGYENFVANLNSFVASRGVLSKSHIPLETLKNAISEVLGDSDKHSVSAPLEVTEEFLKR